jgi:hypothetical protein
MVWSSFAESKFGSLTDLCGVSRAVQRYNFNASVAWTKFGGETDEANGTVV